jgi:hypothetical protein
MNNKRKWIDELNLMFEENDNWQNPTAYEVIERFPRNGERRYTVVTEMHLSGVRLTEKSLTGKRLYWLVD